jgi:hypothetical protein
MSTRLISGMLRDQCYYFYYIFADKFGEDFAVFAQPLVVFAKMLIITFSFGENYYFSAKIAENCDYNIDPR